MSAGKDETIKTWSVRPRIDAEEPGQRSGWGDGFPGYYVFSEDGAYAAVGLSSLNHVRVWDSRTGEIKATLTNTHTALVSQNRDGF